jgi:hypothetical protein
MKVTNSLFLAGLAAMAVSSAEAAADVNWHLEGTVSQILPYVTTSVHGLVSQTLSTQPVAELHGIQVGERFTVDIAVDLGANKATGITFSTASGNLVTHADELNYSTPTVQLLGNRVATWSSGATEMYLQFAVAGLDSLSQPSFADINAILSTGDASKLSSRVASLFYPPASAISHQAELGLSYDKVTVAAVPELSSQWMLSLGLIGLVASTRRRTKSAQQSI